MGVRWLTTYVHEVERTISSVVELEVNNSKEKDSNDQPTFVVDGWAFIFKVWLDLFGDSIRTLDYGHYKFAVESFIQSWLSVGIKVIFIFDGPFLPSKLPAIVKRRAVGAGCNNGFMHSSPQSRMSKALQLESNIIPALIYSATIDACQSKDVKMYFSQTEADSMVAEMASEIQNAYALSQDSDFFILCSRGKGCLGYVPLDGMEYVSKMSGKQEEPGSSMTNSNEEFDEGFQQVSNRRRKGGNRTIGMKALADALPSTSSLKQINSHPPFDDKLHGTYTGLRFTAFSPTKLAAHLELPPSLLPLFAAIVGNDYTTSIQSDLFLRHIEGSKRIPVVANALRTEWLRMQNEVKSSNSNSSRRGSAQTTTTTRLAMTSSMHESDDGRSEYGSSATATPTRNVPGANTKSFLTPSNNIPRDPVRSLVESVVVKLLAQAESGYRYPRVVASGERELIIDSIIDSAATYSILTHSDAPHLISPSAAFFGQALSLLAAQLRKENERIVSPKSITLYRQAYRSGQFREYLIEILTQRIYISRHLPEAPEQPSIQSRAGRELRLWIYAIMFEVWGMEWARKQWEEPERQESDIESEEESMANKQSIFRPDRTYKEGELPDDVISVDTESSSSEIGLDGTNEGNDSDDDLDGLPTRPGSVLAEREEDKPAPGVVEYVRSGNLYVQHLVRIVPITEMLRLGQQDSGAEKMEGKHQSFLPPSLANVLAQHEASQTNSNESNIIPNGQKTPESDPVPGPIVLMPLNVRLDLFLHAHNAYTPQTLALPKQFWLPICVLRFLISSEYDRLQSSNRTRLNWSKTEVKVAVESMLAVSVMTEDQRLMAKEKVKTILPSTRAIHLSSSIQLILDLSHALAQTLLIPFSLKTEGEKEKQQDQWSEPHSCFFGPTFHIGMSKIHNEQEREDESTEQTSSSKLLESVENAILFGLEDCLGSDASDIKKERKAKKREAREAKQQQQEQQQNNGNTITTTSSTKSKPNAARNAFAALLQNDD